MLQQIQKILPQFLHQHWTFVKEGAESIKEKCPLEPWIVEDVYASLRAGWATLHMAENGFLVTQDLTEEFSGRAILHVWLAYSRGGEFEEGEKYLRAICHGRPIRFHSPRLGWARVAKVIKTEYEL